MKVLHLIAGDLRGGAARGAYWLHQALLGLDVNSLVLTNSKDTFGDDKVISLVNTKLGKIANLVRSQLDQCLLLLLAL